MFIEFGRNYSEIPLMGKRDGVIYRNPAEFNLIAENGIPIWQYEFLCQLNELYWYDISRDEMLKALDMCNTPEKLFEYKKIEPALSTFLKLSAVQKATELIAEKEISKQFRNAVEQDPHTNSLSRESKADFASYMQIAPACIYFAYHVFRSRDVRPINLSFDFGTEDDKVYMTVYIGYQNGYLEFDPDILDLLKHKDIILKFLKKRAHTTIEDALILDPVGAWLHWFSRFNELVFPLDDLYEIFDLPEIKMYKSSEYGAIIYAEENEHWFELLAQQISKQKTQLLYSLLNTMPICLFNA